MLLGDPNKVFKALQNLYIRAESLMLNPEGYKPLLTLLSDIRQCFEKRSYRNECIKYGVWNEKLSGTAV